MSTTVKGKITDVGELISVSKRIRIVSVETLYTMRNESKRRMPIGKLTPRSLMYFQA